MKYTDIFELNKTSGNVIIDVALDNYDDYYHEWDHAKYRMRDIHPDLYNFLDECSEQIPLKENLEIRFHIEDEPQNPEREKELKDSYLYYHNSTLLAQQEKIRATRLSVIKSVIFGVVLLWASFFSSEIITIENLLIEIALEGMLIGGWVFIWEAIYMSAYSLREERSEYKRINRLKMAELLFDYPSKTV